MSSFLQFVAHTLYARFGAELSNMCLVFPGRRAKLFFNRALGQELSHEGTPIWQPVSLGIAQLVEQITGMTKTDDLPLLAVLYKTYRSLLPDALDFDAFYHLGTLILQDFQTIDKYRIDARQLFRNIQDLKDIEQDYSFLDEQQRACIRSFWGAFETRKEHTLNRHFLKMWEVMPQLYQSYRRTLEQSGMAYEGMLYRQMADLLGEQGASALPSNHPYYVFIGFNALNACEEVLFSTLQKAGKALFFWDYDTFYVEHDVQEAGLFMRRNLVQFPNAVPYEAGHSDTGDTLSKDPKEMEVIVVPSYVLQAKIVPQVLQHNALPTDIRTAIVLADEELLLPLLYGLAPQEQPINVTMGYPLRQTTLYAFVENWLTIYLSHGKSDLRPLLYHPYNVALPSQEELLHPQDDLETLAQRLTCLIDNLVQEQTLTDADPMLIPALRETRKQLNKTLLALNMTQTPLGLKLFSHLFLLHLSKIAIPFSGEPLQGLQVLGILETRCLDFENVVVLGAQEDFLPKAHPDNSLIPYNMKRAFNLPTPEHHQAMHAYYFYRLMQRAKRITLVYSSQTEGLSNGEVTRYVKQIEAELPNIHLHFDQLSYNLTLPPTPSVYVEKKGAVAEKLKTYLDPNSDSRISPSEIKTYLTCPLQFYYKHIEGLKDMDRELDQQDNLHFGTLVHNALEVLYRPYINKPMQKEDVLALAADTPALRAMVNDMVITYFKEVSHQSTLEITGKWLLLTDVIVKYIKHFVAEDAKRAPFTIRGLEMRFRTQYGGVNLIGIIDRFEERGGRFYVQDYKSGKAKEAQPTILLFSRDGKQNGDEFQVLFYAGLYHNHYHSDRPLEEAPLAELHYLRNQSGQKPVLLPPVDTLFMANLLRVLQEIINFDIPFTQTGRVENCPLCSFNAICRRNKSHTNL